MNKTQMKEELISRYKYIFENAMYILAPYMYEETQNELAERNKRYKKKGYVRLISETPLIYLKKIQPSLLLDLESFLLSDIPLEESKLYADLESKKQNADYLKKVKDGMRLIEKKNSKHSLPIYQELDLLKLDLWELLTILREFINEQSNDLKNKDKKLTALDEYFRINRYRNDGKLWTSGYLINFKDIKNYSNFSAVLPNPNNERKPSRDKDDIGLKESSFIKYMSNQANHYDCNFSILTEQEKQSIYLTFHDELPWDLEKTCEIEEEYIPLMIETRLARPEHTNPCGKTFQIKEEEIFFDSKDKLYRYYQLCPHCGYIVNIPKEILSEGIKDRIEARCQKDSNLFRKMYLYSELFSLDKLSSEDQKRLIKK